MNRFLSRLLFGSGRIKVEATALDANTLEVVWPVGAPPVSAGEHLTVLADGEEVRMVVTNTRGGKMTLERLIRIPRRRRRARAKR